MPLNVQGRWLQETSRTASGILSAVNWILTVMSVIRSLQMSPA